MQRSVSGMRSRWLGEFRYELFLPLWESIRKWPVVKEERQKSNAGLIVKEAGEIVFERRGKSSPLLQGTHNRETRCSIGLVVLCAYAMLNERRNLNTNIAYQQISPSFGAEDRNVQIYAHIFAIFLLFFLSYLYLHMD